MGGQKPPSSPEESDSTGEPLSFPARVRRTLFGSPKSLADSSLFHRLTLVPFLAWIGLGADGLSSSAYGPDEGFRTLGEHTYLLLALAVMTTVTVLVISAAYKRIIEEFPHGGGGYVVATKLLGPNVGVVSGCALLVDYVLTISVSIAAAGDAIFSFLPLAWHGVKPVAEVAFVLGLIVLNIRGVRESVMVLLPVFLVFLLTHAVAILGGVFAHAGQAPAVAAEVGGGFSRGLATLGLGGMAALLLKAYSMGGGTYTGIEAVSNGLPIMREPRAKTGRRTMTYMAASLSFTAAGLLVCYLLWRVTPVEGKTMNAVLFERMAGGLPLGMALVWITLLSEGLLLVVAAQAGFIDGPRVLANMALDNWMPRRFATLSSRLTTQNGIVLMGVLALVVLLYTHGDVRSLVVMYSINVFLTFSLSMLAMTIWTVKSRAQRTHWRRRTGIFATGLLLCVTVLVITTIEKFGEGGWITIGVTALLLGLCFLIRGHYRLVAGKLAQLYQEMKPVIAAVEEHTPAVRRAFNPAQPTAALLVAGYSGLGVHTLLTILRTFKGHYRNLVIISVGVVDSGEFKGKDALDELQARTADTVAKYVELASKLGVPAVGRTALGTDVVDEAEKLCLAVAHDFPDVTFFAGQVIFQRDKWFQHLLHNDTAFALQKRLQWRGRTMVILPARVGS
ncbi:MAG: APC family permease [Candidatus Latescibacteria bacterium]|nr:APC family permease [Candidatus Latescibacterota bacterium]